MNLQTKNCLQFLGIGAVAGLLALTAFVVLSIVVSKSNPVHASITELFASINKPLELAPGLEFLAERQDPVLSLAFMAGYWAILGVVFGTLAFVAFVWPWKATNSRNGTPNKQN